MDTVVHFQMDNGLSGMDIYCNGLIENNKEYLFYPQEKGPARQTEKLTDGTKTSTNYLKRGLNISVNNLHQAV